MHESVVAVYGSGPTDEITDEELFRRPEDREADEPAPPRRRPVRLGTGRLVDDRLVILDAEIAAALDSTNPPRVVRVGIASRLDGAPFVEVVEVQQVVRSPRSGEWAAELWSAAASPTEMEAFADGEPTVPANGWCYFFPSLSFC